MTKTIWKFPLVITDEQTIRAPDGAEFLHVDVQPNPDVRPGEQIMLWALVDPAQLLEARYIRVIGTGHTIPEGDLQHLGSVMMMGGRLVWHVFEILKEEI